MSSCDYMCVCVCVSTCKYAHLKFKGSRNCFKFKNMKLPNGIYLCVYIYIYMLKWLGNIGVQKLWKGFKCDYIVCTGI